MGRGVASKDLLLAFSPRGQASLGTSYPASPFCRLLSRFRAPGAWMLDRKCLSSSEQSTVFMAQGPTKLELMQRICPEGTAQGWLSDFPGHPRFTALADETCPRIICAWVQCMRLMRKIRPRCILPVPRLPAPRGCKHPPPRRARRQCLSVHTLLVVMFFVGLPENVTVQLALLAGRVSQACVRASSWQRGASPAQNWDQGTQLTKASRGGKQTHDRGAWSSSDKKCSAVS